MTPSIPADHDSHDLLLVAAHAAGDTVGSERLRAETLIARCPACAVLAQDLAAIATATRALPPPARSRDFRLSPEDAARSRGGTGWRGVLVRLGSPELRWSRPLAAALTTIGLAGLLVSAAPLFPGGAATGGGAVRDLSAPALAPAPSAGQPGAASAPSAAEPVAGAAGPTAAPAGGAAGPSAAPAAEGKAGRTPTAAPVVAAQGAGRPAASAVGPAFEQGSSARVAPGNTPPPVQAWVPWTAAASTIVLIAGLSLFGIRWAARRRR